MPEACPRKNPHKERDNQPELLPYRGVPEVWGSTYDVRALIDATVKLRDGKKITDMDLPLIPRLALKEALKKIEGTDLEKFLKEYNAI